MRKTVILVPGLLCDEWLWHFQVEALADVAEVLVANHGEVDSLGALAEAIIEEAPAAIRTETRQAMTESGSRASARVFHSRYGL